MKPTYEQLEARIKQLAAENVARKNGNGTAIEFRDFYAWWNIFNEDGLRTEEERMLAAGAWMARSGLGNTDAYQYVAPETPATDTYLSQLRAEGVELAGEYLKQYAQHLHDDARLVLQDARELCSGYASQLREGKAGEVR